ncbi:hypothetical protein F2P56_018118 [Juglans regia]|uniref:Uncharacterized protein LOC109008267 n=2 Tax=Juglans regia TaxID=51240 RepID=A0A2I4GIV3_JUGRE|nr:uncharacterized protein LOC109008267 [Juglans regia]KAF5462079.1 hypothetical protein F2P56_018118 [Juglans regia]
MAESTRAAASKAQQEAVLKQLEDHNHAINSIHERLDQFSDMLKSLVEFQQVNSRREENHEETSFGRRLNQEERFPRGIRLDFPHFDGSNPGAWIFKVTQYFEYHQVSMNQRLLMASYHMEGEALVWYQDAVDGGIFTTWESFVKALLVRFGTTAYDDPMESLTRLKQVSSVASYKAQFEALSNRLKGLSEKHKLSCFMSGLKDEVRLPVKMLNPINLNAAFGLAKIQEEYVLASRRSWKNNTALPVKSHGESVDDSSKFQKHGVPTRRVFSSQMDEKRKKRLCYHCEEKWNPSHVCKNPRVYLIQAEEDKIQPVIEESMIIEEGEVSGDAEDSLEVSVNAISGCSNGNAMKLHGKIGPCSVEILIDSGSTHNFLDPMVVQEAKLKVRKDYSLQVRVANGDKILSQGRGEELIKIQGSKFSVPFHVLTLGGCDIVLGVQWLKTLGNITWNFIDMSMSFEWNDQMVKLQGLTAASVHMLSGTMAIKSDFISQQAWLLQLRPVEQPHNEVCSGGPMAELLEGFQDVFAEPVGLPPKREFDHSINLKDGASPVIVRPYRYPHYQKSEIEQIVHELLQTGVVRPSQSPFSSPVLLVKKADAS